MFSLVTLRLEFSFTFLSCHLSFSRTPDVLLCTVAVAQTSACVLPADLPMLAAVSVNQTEPDVTVTVTDNFGAEQFSLFLFLFLFT